MTCNKPEPCFGEMTEELLTDEEISVAIIQATPFPETVLQQRRVIAKAQLQKVQHKIEEAKQEGRQEEREMILALPCSLAQSHHERCPIREALIRKEEK